MIDTIGPMVRGGGRRDHGVELTHVLGGALGGAATGFVLGAAGAIVGLDEATPVWSLVGLACLAVAALLVDALHDGRKLGVARQTPRAWRHVLPAKGAAFLNGIDLGLGWSTRIYFTSFVVALVAAVVTAHAVTGAAIGASFGLARALFVVIAQRVSNGALSIDSIGDRRGRAVALNGVGLLQFAAAASLAAALAS